MTTKETPIAIPAIAPVVSPSFVAPNVVFEELGCPADPVGETFDGVVVVGESEEEDLVADGDKISVLCQLI
jgi:hypothetical protein